MHKLLRIMRESDVVERALGEADQVDIVSVDVPLLIRMLEYAREDAKTDMDLHNVTTKMVELAKQGTLTMDSYDSIVGGSEEEQDYEDDGQPSEYEEYQDYQGGDDWDHGQYEEDIEEANQSGKTEHSGAKHGKGAYHGHKEDAKDQSNKKRRQADKSAVKEDYGCTGSIGGSLSDENVSYTQTKRQGDASVTVSANAKNMEELHAMLELAGISAPDTDTHEIEPVIAITQEPATQAEPDHGHDDAKAAIIDKLQQSLSQKFNL